jgi:hypothetical protein
MLQDPALVNPTAVDEAFTGAIDTRDSLSWETVCSHVSTKCEDEWEFEV